MYHILTVYIYQSLGDTFELPRSNVSNSHCKRYRQDRTSSNRFASLCFLMYSLMFLFSIHSDAMAKESLSIVTPIRGSTLGWRRAFHVTTSLQNLYGGWDQLVNVPRNVMKIVGTYLCDSSKVTRRVNSQRFDCDTQAFVFTLPHVGEPATVEWTTRSIVAKRYLQ